MEAASAVGTGGAVPTVTIARDPGVDSCGEPVNAGNEKNPSEEIPAGQEASDAGPCVNAGVDSAVRIDCLHQLLRFFSIDLGKAGRGLRVVEIEKLDTLL